MSNSGPYRAVTRTESRVARLVELEADSLTADIELADGGVLILTLTDEPGDLVEIRPGADREAAAKALERLAEQLAEYTGLLRKPPSRARLAEIPHVED